MKGLTICQPYAHLIMLGDKRIENRSWRTLYRGPLAVHAGLSKIWLDSPAMADCRIPASQMTFGAILAVADLVDCLRVEEIRAGAHDHRYPWVKGHKHVSGPWCWVLNDVRPLRQPLPWKGSQGLWTTYDRLREIDVFPATF